MSVKKRDITNSIPQIFIHNELSFPGAYQYGSVYYISNPPVFLHEESVRPVGSSCNSSRSSNPQGYPTFLSSGWRSTPETLEKSGELKIKY